MRPAGVRPRSPLGALVILLGLLASVFLVGLLVRQVARERERAARAGTEQRGAQAQVQTLKGELRESRAEAATLEEDRARRARVVEGEMGALRRDLVEARRREESHREAWRAAAAERDRAVEDLLRARREVEGLRDDLAMAEQRAAHAEGETRAARAEAREAARLLASGRLRIASLVRPFLLDLRSADGSLRVRAHEALVEFAGRDLRYRPNGTPGEREEDAAAIERILLGE